MANEQFTMWNSVENSNENSFLSQLKNLKHAIKLTLLLGLPTMAAWQTTVDNTTVQNNKTQIEVVQQDTDPVKDLMGKFSINILSDIEIMDLKDMVAMLKEVYTITNNNKELATKFSELTAKLEFCIEGSRPDFDFIALKNNQPIISNKQKELEKKVAEIKAKNAIAEEIVKELTKK